VPTRRVTCAFALTIIGAASMLSPQAAGEPAGDVECRVRAADLTTVGCVLLASDTSARRDPSVLWRGTACAAASRVEHRDTGGDGHPTGMGRRQEGGVRALTVLDGDNVYGERCELGRNDRADTLQVYHEGEHRITFLSLRLRRSFPLQSEHWQAVAQMKQVQPADNGGGTPVLALNAYGGRWQLHQSTSRGPSGTTANIWSARARKRVWTRFAFDVVYSQNPGLGRIKLYVDRNGDGDALDAGEESPRIRTYTLKRETGTNARDGLAEGASIPSHLRVGIYHDERIGCPPPRGCEIGVDNVQVVGPR
jgi:Polysaccharide lyase